MEYIKILTEPPPDLETSHRLYIQTAQQYNRALGEIEKLRSEQDWLKRQLFGGKSERFIPGAGQLALSLDAEKTAPPPPSTEKIEYERRKQTQKKEGHGRGVMPTHLPFKDVVIEPEEDVSGLEHIGDEISWELDYEPGSLFVKRYLRPKYARRNGDGIAVGDLPPRAIEKGNAGPGLMGRVVIDKYAYHIPLDRQRKKFLAEDKVEIAESTLCDIVSRTSFWIEPIYNTLLPQLLSSTYIQADETPIPIHVKMGKRKMHKGYFWVYYAPIENIVVFDYRRGRSRDGPVEMLKDFKGILQVDGYEGYNQILGKDGIARAACMAHVRRKFKEALDSDKERCEFALETIGSWFKLEREAKESKMDIEKRLELRKNRIVPSMDKFHAWLKEEYPKVLPKSSAGGAIAYALNQWHGFTPFMNDSRVELSNNLVENAIRPVAIGRKNYMFKGSHEAAKRAAMIYSVIATATRQGHDPFKYFKDILTRMPAASNKQIEQFLPHNWKMPVKTG